jgi:hypothetical protein
MKTEKKRRSEGFLEARNDRPMACLRLLVYMHYLVLSACRRIDGLRKRSLDIYLKVFVHMIEMMEGIIGVFLDNEMRYDTKSR